MFKYLASILFLLLSVPSFCQKKNTHAIVSTIKETNRISKEVYIFPKVIVPNNKLASTKINKTLLAFLDIEKDSVKKSIFENVWEPKNENCAWLYHNLGFKVTVNNNKILCIDVWAEFGKYGTMNTNHYLFDIKTGNEIKLDTLIDQSQRKVFAQLLYYKKDSTIKKILIDLKDSLAWHQKTNDSVMCERDSEQAFSYQECINRDSSDERDLEYIEFYVEKHRAHFILEACFPHVIQAIDDLGDYKFDFTMEEIKRYLSPYAKVILKE